VELAFLELMQPDLPTVVAQQVAAGSRRVTVIPVFLGQGGHVRRDLPQLLEQLRQAHPGWKFAPCRQWARMRPCCRRLPPIASGLAELILPSALRRWPVKRAICFGGGWPFRTGAPFGTAWSGLKSTTSPWASGKPSVSTSDMNLPIWRGGN
jgi:hypothetical protein